MIEDGAPTTPRFPGLDGVRYIAAGMIVLHHSAFASGETFSSRAGPYLARLDAGVAIFFVLSGFLLYRPLVAAQLRRGRAASTAQYLGKRAVRIYPAYWAALWITLVLGGTVVGDTWGFVHTSLLTQVYVPARALSGLQQAWSLAAEVAFYLALPALAALAWRWARHAPPHRRAARLLALPAALCALSLAFRLGAEQLAPVEYRTVMPLWMPAQVDHFALGMTLAIVSVWGEDRSELRATARRLGTPLVRWWLAAAGMFWFTSTQLELARGLDRAGFGAELVRQGMYGAIALAVVAPLALAPDAPGRVRDVLDSRLMRWLGRVSYGLYLWHLWLVNRLPGWRGFPPFSGRFHEYALAGLLGGTALAAVSYHLLEHPLNELVRARLQQRRDRRAATVAP